MAGTKLAELFIDITLRGGAKVELQALRDQIDAADKSMLNNATLYKLQTQGKIDNMKELAARHASLAQLDAATYKSKDYADVASEQAQADRLQKQAQEAKSYAHLTAEYDKFGVAQGKIASMKEEATNQGKIATLDTSTYKSKDYADYAAKQAQADRLQQQAQEAKNYAHLTAEYGKFGATVMNAKQKFAALLPWPLNQIANSANLTMTALAATGAMIHAGKASSPEAASTLDKSGQLASQAIGNLFVDATMKAAAALQLLARGANAAEEKLKFGDEWWITKNILNPVWNTVLPWRWLPDAELSLPNSQGRFGSVDKGWRDLMQASSTGGPLETRIMQQQLEALQRLVQNTNPQNLPNAGNAP